MQTKQLLILSAIFIVIALISFSSNSLLSLAHGFIQNLYGGNSLGKMILMFFWVIVNPLITIAFIKLRLIKRIEKHDRKFLYFFVLLAVIGFFAGMQMYNDFSIQFKSIGPYASMLPMPSTNWEASKLSHNHFPKISIYSMEKATGINLGNKFDDGKPWYELFPNAGLWGAMFSIIIILLIIFGTLHLNSKAQKIRPFDYIVFLAAEIGFIINIIDGGIGSSLVTITVFFFLLYLSRNYFKFKDKIISFVFPLLSLAFVMYPSVLFGFENGSDIITAPIILSFGLLYYFIKSFNEGKLKFKWYNILLFLLLLQSLYFAQVNVINLGFGRTVMDLSNEQIPLAAEQGGGIFIYGLPEKMLLQEFNNEIEKFGSVIESDKVGWVAYARIKPSRPFRTGEIEDYFTKKYPAESYLYVEENIPVDHVNSFIIYWFEDVNSQNFLGKKFLGMTVEGVKDNAKDKTSEIIIKSKTDQAWQMLSILTEIREKGFNGKILISKKS